MGSVSVSSGDIISQQIYIRFLLCARHRTGDIVINRADVVLNLVEDTAFLDRG